MEHSEEKCLTRIAESYNMSDFWDKISEITGVFILGWINEEGNINVITDPSGMQSSFYGEVMVIFNNFTLSAIE